MYMRTINISSIIRKGKNKKKKIKEIKKENGACMEHLESPQVTNQRIGGKNSLQLYYFKFK